MTQTKHIGYVEDAHGYSGAFSWWRSDMDSRFWFVAGHGPFCKTGQAVTDDFGNLVEVPA